MICIALNEGLGHCGVFALGLAEIAGQTYFRPYVNLQGAPRLFKRLEMVGPPCGFHQRIMELKIHIEPLRAINVLSARCQLCHFADNHLNALAVGFCSQFR